MCHPEIYLSGNHVRWWIGNSWRCIWCYFKSNYHYHYRPYIYGCMYIEVVRGLVTKDERTRSHIWIEISINRRVDIYEPRRRRQDDPSLLYLISPPPPPPPPSPLFFLIIQSLSFSLLLAYGNLFCFLLTCRSTKERNNSTIRKKQEEYQLSFLPNLLACVQRIKLPLTFDLNNEPVGSIIHRMRLVPLLRIESHNFSVTSFPAIYFIDAPL